MFTSFLTKLTFHVLVVFLLLTIPANFEKISFASICPCEDDAQCHRITTVDHLKQYDKEVIVMSTDYNEPRKTWRSWHWPSISSVISTGNPDTTLMCHTHRKGRRYGFSGKLVPSLLSGNENNPTLTSWLKNTTELARKNFVDLFLLDMLDVLSPDMNSSRLELVLKTAKTIKTSLYYVHHNISLLCLVPWQPPCYKSRCNFAENMTSLCEFFILSADSFLPAKGEKCLARATVPFPQLHLGFDEYMMNQLPAHKFILSIPWHGYAYHCNEFIPLKSKFDYDQCIVKVKDGSCDYEHCRQKIDMNQLTTTYDNHFSHEDFVWHKRYIAPYFIVKNETSNETTQVWFENLNSLHEKYIFVRNMKMGGVALWSGNDLHHASKSWFKGFNDAMWSWVIHGMYLQKDNHQPYDENLASLPKKMAGIGIGCVFIGGFLGFIFGWGVFQRSHRKNRRQPFEKDMDYMEEDQNL